MHVTICLQDGRKITAPATVTGREFIALLGQSHLVLGMNHPLKDGTIRRTVDRVETAGELYDLNQYRELYNADRKLVGVIEPAWPVDHGMLPVGSAAVNVNEILRDHQLQHSEVLIQLHQYLPRIVQRFYGELPVPALSWEPDDRRILGSYREEDGLTLCHRINLNSRYASRPLADHLATLTHELGHEWEHLCGKPTRPPYHSKRLRQKLEEIGIPCNAMGHAVGMKEPFTSFLRDLGVDVETLQPLRFKQEPELPEGRPGSKLKKWRCGCTNIRAAVQVFATCQKCGITFSQVQ
jgi:hypothetical protein